MLGILPDRKALNQRFETSQMTWKVHGVILKKDENTVDPELPPGEFLESLQTR